MVHYVCQHVPGFPFKPDFLLCRMDMFTDVRTVSHNVYKHAGAGRIVTLDVTLIDGDTGEK